MADKDQTIIIKKINKGGHGHHGGAWKVAYADFVTAMMAFFLLLWILTATPVESLEGLADYFSPTVGLQGKMGIGFSGGSSPNTEGWSRGDWASMGLIFGAPPSGPIIKMPETDNKSEENDPITFDKMQESVSEALENNKALGQFKDNILITQTPEGLVIQIRDQNKRPMFEDGTAILQSQAKIILERISSIISYVPNYIRIAGHTKKEFLNSDPNYSNWELSADRANSARRFMLEKGISNSQIIKVVAHADNEPVRRDDLNAPENSRISITLLKRSMISAHKQPAPDDIILGPVDSGLKDFIQIKRRDPEAQPSGARDKDGNPIEYTEE